MNPYESCHDTFSKNNQDVVNLGVVIRELNGRVALLADNHKTLNALLESKVEHNVEIGYIKKAISEILLQISNIQHRLDKLEKWHEFQSGEKSAREKFFAAVRDYWPIIMFVGTSVVSMGWVLWG